VPSYFNCFLSMTHSYFTKTNLCSLINRPRSQSGLRILEQDNGDTMSIQEFSGLGDSSLGPSDLFTFYLHT
jgi:hypothetical protein